MCIDSITVKLMCIWLIYEHKTLKYIAKKNNSVTQGWKSRHTMWCLRLWKNVATFTRGLLCARNKLMACQTHTTVAPEPPGFMFDKHCAQLGGCKQVPTIYYIKYNFLLSKVTNGLWNYIRWLNSDGRQTLKIIKHTSQ